MQKKKFFDSIRVENPCTEKWDEMVGNDQVRFCSHGEKDVNNISSMTARQAEKLVRRSGGRLCVRYRTDPRSNRPVFAQRVSSIARHGAAAGVLGASLLTAAAYTRRPEPSSLNSLDRANRKAGDTSARTYGS